MTSASNDYGRAYEYIFIKSLHEVINSKREAYIIRNSQLDAAEDAWNRTRPETQNNLQIGAISAVDTLFELEPLIIEDGDDALELKIQADATGTGGDVRDILIIRRELHWEIGLSLKHNHFDAKHSRLSGTIDFGEKWFEVPCSQQYWEDITPIFNTLREYKSEGKLWRDLPNKEDAFYKPILDAFAAEIQRSYETHGDIPQKMVEYFLGEYDFYKVIGIDRQRVTQIQTFNLHGTLNRNGEHTRATITIPRTALPTRIIHIGYKPDSDNTLEMYLDGGWTFSFRIHNASSRVEPSLKFAIAIVGVPTTIITINCTWH